MSNIGRFIAVGHRGAPREFPPNTMAGFRRAAEIGCAMVECDVRRSRDGELVLCHDGHVTLPDGQTIEVIETATAALAALDLGSGEGVPTLSDLVALALASGVAIMADMKAEGGGVEEFVADLLKPFPTGQKIVPGASLEARRRFRASDPDLPLSLSIGRGQLTERQFQQILADKSNLCIDAVTFEWPLLTADRVISLQQAGLCVFAWTVDDDLLMAQVAGWGVDGVISNRTELVVGMSRGAVDHAVD